MPKCQYGHRCLDGCVAGQLTNAIAPSVYPNFDPHFGVLGTTPPHGTL
ncbi:hypothetical protein [Stenomitos frigidus]|nr:hypothetical protein [Stenomitos frigidus]